MKYVGLKLVGPATAQWALSAYKSTQALPVDAAGPVSVQGGISKGRGSGDGLAIGTSRRKTFCEKHGITPEGRRFYQKLLRKGFPTFEAMRIVKKSKDQRYLTNDTAITVARPD
jgi:hypothetical protein